MVTAELDRTDVLLAPGQGNQRVGGGLELAKRSEEAMRVWQYADQALLPSLKIKLTDVAWNGTADQIKRTDFAQLIVTTESLARNAALKETGQLGYPWWHAGNSVGFIAALVNAGSLSLESAVHLAQGRGEAFIYAKEHSPKTAMFAINGIGSKVDRGLVLELVDKEVGDFKLEVCLINADSQWVLGGPVEQVDEAKAYLKEQGLKEKEDFSPLEVDAAFHSKYMSPAVDIWRQVVKDVSLGPTLYGDVMGGSTAMPLLTDAAIRRELVLQLTETERYRDLVWALRARGVTTFTELNATTRLTRMNRENFANFEGLQSAGLVLPEGERLVIAHRLTVPWIEMVSRDEIKDWYLDELAIRQNELGRDEIEEGMHFVDGLGLESGDIMAIRAKLDQRFGRIVPDDEASRNVYVGQAIDATYRLVNS